jgi:clan AA aspartic protease
MGRTLEKVKVQSFEDILKADEGRMAPSRIRTVEFEAVVDTGATYLCLPPSAIAELGLRFSHLRMVNTANGDVERRIFKGADVTILGRNEQMSVMENDATTPPLIGYLVLEALDFVVDPKSQRLIPNPAHGGKWTADLY